MVGRLWPLCVICVAAYGTLGTLGCKGDSDGGEPERGSGGTAGDTSGGPSTGGVEDGGAESTGAEGGTDQTLGGGNSGAADTGGTATGGAPAGGAGSGGTPSGGVGVGGSGTGAAGTAGASNSGGTATAGAGGGAGIPVAGWGTTAGVGASDGGAPPAAGAPSTGGTAVGGNAGSGPQTGGVAGAAGALPECNTTDPAMAGITIHEIQLLDSAGQPIESGTTDPIWTNSPITVRMRVSGREVAAGPADVPIMVGLVPVPDYAEYLESALELQCPMGELMLRNVGPTEAWHEFKYVIIPDECFKQGSDFALICRWDSVGYDVHYLVNLAVQPDPLCEVTAEDEDAIVYIPSRAASLPNSDCSSTTTGGGCAWEIPVNFCDECYDVRLDNLSARSSVGTVSTLPTSTEAEYVAPLADAVMAVIPFGRENKLDTPADAPRGTSIFLEYWLKPQGDAGLGDPLLIAEGGAEGDTPDWHDATTHVALTQFMVNQPTEYEHALYPDEVLREKLVAGDWATATTFTVTGCLRANDIAVPLDEDCMTFDVELTRAEPEGSFRGGDSEVPPEPLTAFATIPADAPAYQLARIWNRDYGKASTVALRVRSHSWNQVDKDGAEGDHVFYADVSALQGALSRTVIDARAAGSVDVTPGGEVAADLYLKVLRSNGEEQVVLDRSYAAPNPLAAWNYSVTYCVNPKPRFAIGPLPVRLDLCVNGTAGMESTIDVGVTTGPGPAPWDQHSRLGHLGLVVSPYAELFLTASVSADLFLAQAGVEGQLVLLNARLPISGRVEWGVPVAHPTWLEGRLAGDTELELQTMYGRVVGFTEAWSLSKWAWERRNYPIFTFSGRKYVYPLISKETDLLTFQ